MGWIVELFINFFSQIFPPRESFAKKIYEIKLHMLTGAAMTQRYIGKKLIHNLTPLPLRLNFSAGVSLRRFSGLLIDIKSTKTTETQRHIKKNLSSPFWLFFFACVSLWYLYVYLQLSKSKTVALEAQWNNISFKEIEHLKLKSNYVLASVVPSGFSYISCLQKRIKKQPFSPSKRSRFLCLFAFGAFQFVYPQFNINIVAKVQGKDHDLNLPCGKQIGDHGSK
jgi:hypothetical protein